MDHRRGDCRVPAVACSPDRSRQRERTHAFKSATAMGRWLAKHHAKSPGTWIRFFKKGTGVESVTATDALDVALCYGWITGQARPYDGQSWLVRFTPRRPKSIWSRVNTLHAERLIKEGRMQPSGLKEIETAKADGRWARAYHPPKSAVLPDDFVRALNKSTKAKAFFAGLNRANVYAIIFRLHHTKDPDRRERKIEKFIAMLEKGETLH